MTIPTVAAFENGGKNLDSLEAIMNGNETVTTASGTEHKSISQHLAKMDEIEDQLEQQAAEQIASMAVTEAQLEVQAAEQLADQNDEFQNRFAQSDTPIAWTDGLYVENKLQLYFTGTKGESGYSVWLPNPNQMPFTTGSSFSEDEALNRWKVQKTITELHAVALQVGCAYDEIIYSTDTTTVLAGVLYIFVASTQLTYVVPELTTTGETIVALSTTELVTTVGTYAIYKYSRPTFNTPEMFNIPSNGDDGSVDNWEALFSAGLKIQGTKDAVYSIPSQVDVYDESIDFDLGGATIVNTSATDRMLIVEYPYSEIQNVTAVDLVNYEIDVTDSSVYQVGDRVKVVSEDRAVGNRAAPGDGSDYWQAQTLTVSDITGDTLEFREPFEEDFSFATNPKVMKFNKKSCRIYNGTMCCEKGFSDSRLNGLVRVKGGSNHKITVDVENANNTAIEFWGSDYPKAKDSAVSNIGRNTDTSGSHGYSFISCNGPKVTNSDFNRCRHGMTTNDTPTQYSASDFYQMGPTYDMQVSTCTNKADLADAYSTHHGVRRARFSNIEAIGCAVGVGVRGRDVTVNGLKATGCGEGAFVYSESGIATVDKTTRWYLTDIETVNITGDNDLQVQECQFGTLGACSWKGGAPNGWLFNNGGTVAVHGHQEFFSDATFNLDGNYLHIVNTNVEIFATMSIDIDSMTVNGTNNVIRATSDRYFKAYNQLAIEEPVGIDNIFRHIGTGAVVLGDVRYTENINFPFNASGSDIRWKGMTHDGAYNTGTQVKTATDAYNLSFNNDINDMLVVTLLTSGGNFSLSSIADGKFTGQRLLLRVVDTVTSSSTFTLVASISNLSLAGTDIVMNNLETRRFYWSGSEWVIESRNA